MSNFEPDGGIRGEHRPAATVAGQDRPDGTGPQVPASVLGRAGTAAEAASVARRWNQHDAERGLLTWRDVLTAEMCEVFAESDPAGLRAALLRLVAEATRWVEAIDRRTGTGDEPGITTVKEGHDVPIPDTSGDVTVTLPSRVLRRVAQSAIESAAPQVTVAGLILADALGDGVDCEDLPPDQHAERHLIDVPVMLFEVSDVLDGLRDAVYHLDTLRIEHRTTPTLPNKGDVMQLVSQASLLLRSARALATEVRGA